jgi:5-methylcytosine-specific restriction endonuclease McrA
MTAKEYQKHLTSDYWRHIRRQALQRAGYHCERRPCGNSLGLQVHHLHYGSLGREALEDVQVLCDACHRQVTALDHKCRLCGGAAFADAEEAAVWLTGSEARYGRGPVKLLFSLRPYCSRCEHRVCSDPLK